MRFLNVKNVFSQAAVAITGFVDIPLTFGGSGLALYIETTNGAAGNFTFSIGALTPTGGEVTLITSAAVVTDTTTRLEVLPGVLAQVNISANDVLPGKARFRYTRAAGNFDFNVWAAMFG